jgi:glycosyltransferase involved in cell wall biosynthesis
MISKSILVKPDSLDQILEYLTHRFGYPVYDEELVIYIGKICKISLRRSGMVCRWISPKREETDIYGRTKHRLSVDLRNVKDTLLFFAEHYGPEGVINAAPMLSFGIPSRKIWINVRPESLVGPMISFLMPSNFIKQSSNVRYFRALRRSLQPFVKAGLRRQIAAIRQRSQPYIHQVQGKSPFLAQPIIDFCRRNGLMHPLRWTTTYRDLLQERDNDYGKYEQVFRRVTNVELLSTSAYPPIRPARKVQTSIIIPCWNVDNTIHKTLAAISSQRVPQVFFDCLEVILVDDGSTTPVSQVLGSWSYPFRINIIRLTSNHGVSHARELGLVHASGDVVIFMDGDILLSKNYLADHVVRNSIIRDAVFICFKENVAASDERISDERIAHGLDVPDYSKDSRIYKQVAPNAIGSYRIKAQTELRILEETGYLKRFAHKNYGPYDLSCMVIGHNFSSSRGALRRAEPFHRMFRGYGMEDVYFGLRMISHGCFIIPVLSSGVYHIDHPPRAGSIAKQQEEKRNNTRLINKFLDSPVE